MSDVTWEQIGLTWPQKMAGATLVVMPIVCVYVFLETCLYKVLLSQV